MYRIKCPSPSVKESAKLILDPRPDPDQQPNLLTARESLVGYADCVCLVDIHERVRELSLSQYDRRQQAATLT